MAAATIGGVIPTAFGHDLGSGMHDQAHARLRVKATININQTSRG